MKGKIRFGLFCNKDELTTLSETIDEISFIEWEKENGKTELTNREKEELEIAESMLSLLKKNKTLIENAEGKGYFVYGDDEEEGYEYTGALIESIVEKESLTANELNYQIELTIKYLSSVFKKYAFKVDVETSDQESEGFSEGFSKKKNSTHRECDYHEMCLMTHSDEKRKRDLQHHLEVEADFVHFNEELDAFMAIGEAADEVLFKYSYVPRRLFENKNGIIEKDTERGYIWTYCHFGDFFNEKGESACSLDESLPFTISKTDICVYLYVADNLFDTDTEHYNESSNTFTAYNKYVDKTIEVPADKFRDENGEFVKKQVPVKQDDDYYFVTLNI